MVRSWCVALHVPLVFRLETDRNHASATPSRPRARHGGLGHHGVVQQDHAQRRSGLGAIDLRQPVARSGGRVRRPELRTAAADRHGVPQPHRHARHPRQHRLGRWDGDDHRAAAGAFLCSADGTTHDRRWRPPARHAAAERAIALGRAGAVRARLGADLVEAECPAHPG